LFIFIIVAWLNLSTNSAKMGAKFFIKEKTEMEHGKKDARKKT